MVKYTDNISSTNKNGELFNLILLPESLMEYVVVHELCHLRYLNHSEDFWNCSKQILPDYKERETELKKYGGLLYN